MYGHICTVQNRNNFLLTYFCAVLFYIVLPISIDITIEKIYKICINIYMLAIVTQ